ncbi:MAG: TIGR00730 family Rossman fold protein [Nitrospira sp. WS238]|nr:TIGR00730 family Rossman fold protein [Nitrospira sp. WS238]
MNTAGKSSQTRTRPVLSRDEMLHQISALLDSPEDDLHAALMRELLTGLLKLNDAHLDLLDIKIVNRAVKELRHAFGVFHGYRHRQKVSIFGSARTPSDDPNYRLAHQFAHAIVQEGFMVITGGADGIMRASQEGAGRENSFGVNIMLPFEQGPNATIADDQKLITFKYFFTRKLMFQKEANAIALFPGGFGTHDEGFEILTLAQTGKSDPQPIICLQAPGCDYWDDWSAFVVRQLLRRKLINEEDMSLFVIVDSADAAVKHILRFYRRYHSIRFVGPQLAMRLKQPISPDQLEQIQARFADLLSNGIFELRGPLDEELDEPTLRDLPRLVFNFNRRSAGRLRQLIAHLNEL